MGYLGAIRQRHRKSLFKGVQKRGNKWLALIYLPGKIHVPLGSYDDARSAALAFDEAARHFGKDAVLNFPNEIAPPTRPWIRPDPKPGPYYDASLGCYRLPLTKGREALIDAVDVGLVSKWQWHVQPHPDFPEGIPVRHSKDGPIHLRSVLICAKPYQFIRNINDNLLDCRRANLTVADQSRCSRSMRKRKEAKSIYKGVSKRGREKKKRRKKWRAYIGIGNTLRYKHLGDFLDERSAAKAYDAAALKYFGPDARTNFPVPGRRFPLPIHPE